jgi:hypothetical protein
MPSQTTWREAIPSRRPFQMEAGVGESIRSKSGSRFVKIIALEASIKKCSMT